MTDIFNEVDEEVRREQLKKLWDRYGTYLIALCVLVVIGVGAWRGYQWWQGKQAERSGAAFQQAVELAEAGKHQQAEAAFAKLAADGTAGYRALARLRQAAELAPTDRAAAVKAYDEIAADGSASQVIRDLATVRDLRIDPETRYTVRPPSNMPVQRTTFIGREREVANLRQLLSRADVRLISDNVVIHEESYRNSNVSRMTCAKWAPAWNAAWPSRTTRTCDKAT